MNKNNWQTEFHSILHPDVQTVHSHVNKILILKPITNNSSTSMEKSKEDGENINKKIEEFFTHKPCFSLIMDEQTSEFVTP
jgi:hypothetical protein